MSDERSIRISRSDHPPDHSGEFTLKIGRLRKIRRDQPPPVHRETGNPIYNEDIGIEVKARAELFSHLWETGRDIPKIHGCGRFVKRYFYLRFHLFPSLIRRHYSRDRPHFEESPLV